MHIDTILHLVCRFQVMPTQPSGPAAELVGAPVVAAAAYMRDRVGVPRGEPFLSCGMKVVFNNCIVFPLFPAELLKDVGMTGQL
jgi:hypothetical protein